MTLAIFRYRCKCGHDTMKLVDVDKVLACIPCENCGKMAKCVVPVQRRHNVQLPREWVSFNAGCMPSQVAEANVIYVDLGVRFDRKGNAHVPRGRRDAFLKRRGMADPYGLVHK